jgi:ComF family protein
MDVDRADVAHLSACFCDDCFPVEPPGFTPPFCPACGRMFDRLSPLNTEGPLNTENHLCQTCISTPLVIHWVRAAFLYQGIIKEAIPIFKYQSKLSLALVFETYLFDAFERFFGTVAIDLILPVPLHLKKMKRRGFNQSFLLVRNFQKKYRSIHGKTPGWQIDTRTLLRVKSTRPQTGFDIQQRQDNLKGAFAIKKNANLSGKNILLVDDVYTTGATCGEAARLLLKFGANRVDVLVLARA